MKQSERSERIFRHEVDVAHLRFQEALDEILRRMNRRIDAAVGKPAPLRLWTPAVFPVYECPKCHGPFVAVCLSCLRRSMT